MNLRWSSQRGPPSGTTWQLAPSAAVFVPSASGLKIQGPLAEGERSNSAAYLLICTMGGERSRWWASILLFALSEDLRTVW